MPEIDSLPQPIIEDVPIRGLLHRSSVLALLLAGSYTLLSSVYIRISSSMAATQSRSVVELQQIEQNKGIWFVVVSGLLLFLVSYALLKALQHRNEQILRSRNVLIASERLAIAGIFASSMAHDINNILVVIQGNLELLKVSATLSDSDRLLVGELETCSDRLSVMSRRLMHSARQNKPGSMLPGDLVAVVQETLDFARTHQRVKLCTLTAELPESLPLRINQTLMTRALLNLVINAADATSTVGKILVVVRQEGGDAVLQVHDNGSGVPVDVAEHIFEPFYTSKPDGNGLGLLSVRNCTQEHGGKVGLVPSRLGGAAFEMRMPLVFREPDVVAGMVSY